MKLATALTALAAFVVLTMAPSPAHAASCNARAAALQLERLDRRADVIGEFGRVGEHVCLDFTRDGRTDMAFTIAGGGSGGASQWVAYAATKEGSWRLVLHPSYDEKLTITVRGRQIVIAAPLYVENDSHCCPTGGQILRYYAWDGRFLRRLRVVTLRKGKAASRTVSADGATTRIGALTVTDTERATTSLGSAISAYGPPSSRLSLDGESVCRVTWRDLAVSADFHRSRHDGPRPACHRDFYFGQARLGRGWSTDAGLAVGAATAQIRLRYPSAQLVAGRWELLTITGAFSGDPHWILAAAPRTGRVADAAGEDRRGRLSRARRAAPQVRQAEARERVPFPGP